MDQATGGGTQASDAMVQLQQLVGSPDAPPSQRITVLLQALGKVGGQGALMQQVKDAVKVGQNVSDGNVQLVANNLAELSPSDLLPLTTFFNKHPTGVTTDDLKKLEVSLGTDSVCGKVLELLNDPSLSAIAATLGQSNPSMEAALLDLSAQYGIATAGDNG